MMRLFGKCSGFTTAVVCAALITAAGCAKKQETKPDESAMPSTETALNNDLGSSDDGKASGLQTIHFAFDSFALDDQTKGVLKANGDILKAHASMKIQIEGHTDARGGIQYNIALGEKRANSVRSYLVDMGVSGDRLSTVSFGKERPLDSGTTEEAYAKNRRANFAITSR